MNIESWNRKNLLGIEELESGEIIRILNLAKEFKEI